MIFMIVFFVVLAAIFNSIMDKLQFHYETSIFSNWNPMFWNPKESWRNKWKNGEKKQGEKFWLSSTALVFLTDGWHLCQFLQNTCIFLSVAIAMAAAMGFNWMGIAIIFLILRVVYGLIFELFFSKIWKKK